MSKRGNKGWLKVLEASISMGLIMGFVVLVYSQGIERPNPGEAVLAWQGNILDELKDKVALRDAVLNKPETTCLVGGEVYNYAKEKVAKIFPGFGFECRVCNPGEICGAKYSPVERGEIYSEQRIISSTLTKFDPKKVKLFIFPLQKGETQENLVEVRMNETTGCWAGNYECTDWICNSALSRWERQCTDTCTKVQQPTESKFDAGCPPTVEDTLAPGMIQLPGLTCVGNPATSSTGVGITCTWKTPTDTDFKSSIIYLGEAIKETKTNSPNTAESYIYTSLTGTTAGTNYKVKVLTQDNSGKINNTIILGSNELNCVIYWSDQLKKHVFSKCS